MPRGKKKAASEPDAPALACPCYTVGLARVKRRAVSDLWELYSGEGQSLISRPTGILADRLEPPRHGCLTRTTECATPGRQRSPSYRPRSTAQLRLTERFGATTRTPSSESHAPVIHECFRHRSGFHRSGPDFRLELREPTRSLAAHRRPRVPVRLRPSAKSPSSLHS
jgi:hypothetical protein